MTRGDPREQYKRVVHVYHPSMNQVQYRQICAAAWPGRATVGGSFDDGGIGNLDERSVVCWGVPDPEQNTYEGWYALHYPGVEVSFRPGPFWIENPVARPLYVTWGGAFDNSRTYDGVLYRHEGVDLQATLDGVPVACLAAQEGIVEQVRENPAGWGKYVTIRHDWPDGSVWWTVYAHLERIDAAVGQSVRRGQHIGLCGSTGNSDGIHLHFTLQNVELGTGRPRYVVGYVVNPLDYLLIEQPS